MTLDEDSIRSVCTDAVFERGQNYRREGRIQTIDRFEETVTATVRGSSRYDVTVELGGSDIDARCTCPYDGAGECKHVVAVLLEVAGGMPEDESERVDDVIEDVPAEDLRSFVHDALVEYPELRDQFLAGFGGSTVSVEDYREDIQQLFDDHDDGFGVMEAIDFSHFFEVAEQYRERERYLAAATVYRALFETIDDNEVLIEAAYDHYARSLQRALDGYVDCVLATDPGPEELDRYTGVLAAQAESDPRINSEQFRRAIDDLEERAS